MASRGEIRDAVTSELRSVSGTYPVTDADGTVVDEVTLPADNISLRHPEGLETLPGIVYHEDYRSLTFNGAGSGPDVVIRDAQGRVEEELWREYVEGQFIIDVRASDEVVKEPLYEALHTTFGRYQMRPWPLSDLHDDIIDIDVDPARTADTADAEDVIRGDQMEVRVTFYRNYSLNTSTIERVETNIDEGNDGDYEISYTTLI